MQLCGYMRPHAPRSLYDICRGWQYTLETCLTCFTTAWPDQQTNYIYAVCLTACAAILLQDITDANRVPNPK